MGQTPFWADAESLQDAHDSAAIMVPEAAARVRAYTAAVWALAADVELDRLESMPGIADTDGPGLIHAWMLQLAILHDSEHKEAAADPAFLPELREKA